MTTGGPPPDMPSAATTQAAEGGHATAQASEGSLASVPPVAGRDASFMHVYKARPRPVPRKYLISQRVSI